MENRRLPSHPFQVNEGDSENRYRLKREIALKLGLTPNNSGRYRLTTEQTKQLFNMDIQPIKRLFFDIENTPFGAWVWNAYPKFIPNDMKREEQKIICISYKWENEDKIHRLVWENEYPIETIKEINKLLSKAKLPGTKKLCKKIIKDYLFNGCDKKLVKQFVEVAKEADEIIAHNGDRHDIKILRTRAIKHRIPSLPKYRTLDTLKKLRGGFKFFSNRLDAIAKDLGVGAKIKHDGWSMWERTINGDIKALNEMGNYCDGDIVVLEDVFIVLQNYIKNNTHTGVINGKLKCSCANCGSEDVSLVKNNFTALGTIKRLMECNTCDYNYETSNSAYRTFLEMKQNQLISSE